ncbi:MAG: hypothetical protein CM1200mP30_00020 [Pseudomonadota bacterium]|nr:MAG: hypothetical protein CM1200mP30_00020 [Pseudomonadota bacterium]
MTAQIIDCNCLVYGCFVTGKSASITTGAIESATKDSRGVTLAVHSSMGFYRIFFGTCRFWFWF